MTDTDDNPVELLDDGYRYALALCRHREDAEDLVHDAWVRLVQRYQRPPEKPLLFRTIRNAYFDRLRQEKVHLEHRENIARAFEHTPVDILKVLGDAEEVGTLMARLRDVENEALYLSAVEGYTAEEIAALSGSTRGTVLSIVHRARQKLRRWIAEGVNEAQHRGVRKR